LNLFEWAKTQNDAIQIKKLSVSVQKSCNKVIDLLSLQIKQKSIIVLNKIKDSENIEVDKNMFETIIRNVLTNGIKYSTIGGEIILTTTNTNNTITLVIKDTGVGMDEKTLSQLFELNKLPSIVGTSGESGTGLGMIICKEFVALNEGTIRAESEMNSGTTFYVTFPRSFQIPESSDIQEVEEVEVFQAKALVRLGVDAEMIEPMNDALTIEEDASDEVGELHQSKPHVVLVEDTLELRESIKKVLLTKFNVSAFENGSLALKSVQKNLPDLIITDVMMPVMDGLTLSKKLKKDFNTCHIPIILLTSLNEDEDKLKGIESGADDYIVKPFKTNLLLSKASNLIDSRKMLQKKFISEFQTVPSEIAQTSMDEKFIQDAITLIESNIEDSEFTVDIFSAKLNMSQSSLLRKLKGITGQSPNQFIRSIRLKRAAQLLKQSDLNVNEVCYKVGFNDVKYFRQCFQKQFGVNPGEAMNDSNN
jgi:DNA-binding response OmpR family regulator/anti-sigma regulatory factor (Ser/Thr protein kinase)